MSKYNMNFIVKLSAIMTVCIMIFLLVVKKDDIPFKVVCIIGLIIGTYILLYAYVSSFTVHLDKLVVQRPFKIEQIYWNDIALISAVEYRKNNYNIYLSPRKEATGSNFKKSILINWQFNNHKELVKKIVINCEESKNTYIDKKVYNAIRDL